MWAESFKGVGYGTWYRCPFCAHLYKPVTMTATTTEARKVFALRSSKVPLRLADGDVSKGEDKSPAFTPIPGQSAGKEGVHLIYSKWPSSTTINMTEELKCIAADFTRDALT